jgi:hypothetical protein
MTRITTIPEKECKHSKCWPSVQTRFDGLIDLLCPNNGEVVVRGVDPGSLADMSAYEEVVKEERHRRREEAKFQRAV